jgi:hypothetical protein
MWFKNQFTEEREGMVFSIDLMLALIILTVLLGFSADAMDIIGWKMEDYSYTNSLERITMGGADMLIKEPGSPENWEELGDLKGVTPGLADIDPATMKVRPNTLSVRKINCLKESYDELIRGKVIPPYCNSSLTICPVDQSLEPITMGEVSISSSTDVMVVNRSVLCNLFNTSIMVFIDDMKYNSSLSEQKYLGEECPHQSIVGNSDHLKVDYRNHKPGWTCYHFRVNQDMLNSIDFYLMTDPVHIADPSAVWIIDCPENITENVHSFSNMPVRVNDQVSECLGNRSTAVLWLHVFSSGNPEQTFNTYLAGFPKGTPIEQVKTQYLSPQPCYFVFKVGA